MEPAPISVRFFITRMDLFRLQLRALTRHRFVLVVGLVCLTSLGSTLVGTVATPERSAVFYLFFLGVWLVPAALFFGLLLVLVAACQAGLGDHSGSLGEHAISFEPDGLADCTEFSTSLHRWAGIARVESTTRYLLVFVNDFQCHLIPKRAFASPLAAQEFEQRVRDHIRTAQVGNSKTP